MCGRFDYRVGYQHIYWVEEKPEWIHIGDNTYNNHGGMQFNHWMKSHPNCPGIGLANCPAWGLWHAAVWYLANHPNQPCGKIAVNDMSLPFGGQFDLNQNWQAPNHIYHRRGESVDVRGNSGACAIPNSDQETFRQHCLQTGQAKWAIIESQGTTNQHIHCDWGTYGQP